MRKFIAIALLCAAMGPQAVKAQITNGYYKMTANVETVKPVEGVEFLSECYVKVDLKAGYQHVVFTSPELPMLSSFDYDDDYCNSATCYTSGTYPVDTDHDLYIYDVTGDYSASVSITATDEGFKMDDITFYTYTYTEGDVLRANYTNVLFTYLGEEKPEGYVGDDEDGQGEEEPTTDPTPDPEEVQSILAVGTYNVTATCDNPTFSTEFQFTVVDNNGQKVIGQFLYDTDYYSLNYTDATIDSDGITWGYNLVWGEFSAIGGGGWDFTTISMPDDTNKQSVTDNGDGTYTLGDFNVGNWSFFGNPSIDAHYTNVVATPENATTGITTVHVDSDTTAIYNLNGTRVSNVRRGQIIIRNGKKYIVK